MVVLVSSDNIEFTVDKDVAAGSVVIRNMLEDIGDTLDQPIPVLKVQSGTLKKILEYCTHYRHDFLKDESEFDFRNVLTIPQWDQEFLSMELALLFDVINAANYLDIERLLEFGCLTVANMIRGKTPEEIRRLFNVENDFSPEEEARIRKENDWAENL